MTVSFIHCFKSKLRMRKTSVENVRSCVNTVISIAMTKTTLISVFKIENFQSVL